MHYTTSSLSSSSSCGAISSRKVSNHGPLLIYAVCHSDQIFILHVLHPCLAVALRVALGLTINHSVQYFLLHSFLSDDVTKTTSDKRHNSTNNTRVYSIWTSHYSVHTLYNIQVFIKRSHIMWQNLSHFPGTVMKLELYVINQ